jgi:phosphatidate cytidylyltransferase
MFDLIDESNIRIKTGIILIVIFLVVGFIDSFFITWFLLGVLMFIALYEALELFRFDDEKIYIYAAIIWLVASFYPNPENLVFVVGIIFASILAYTQEFNKQLFIPLMYPIVSFLFLWSLYVSYGMESLLWLVAIVASADIGAYFIGKNIGQTKFCQTSPNKTLEGVTGGIITASILGSIFSIDGTGFFLSLFISILVALASIFGDLFESYLKREADVKDSGDILPGHGGILDRTDSYLFGGIIMLVLLRLFV